MKHTLCIVSALIVMSAVVFVSCPTGDDTKPGKPPDDKQPSDKVETTNLGLTKTTAVVKNPSQDVTISVFSDGKVAAQETGELMYNQAFIPNSADSVNWYTSIGTVRVGDVVHIDSDYQYIKVEMFGLKPAILFSPTGEFVFQIPAAGTANPVWQRPYPVGTFTGSSYTLKASVATDAEIQEERNLALNPYDFHYKNEINVPISTTGDAAPNGSLPDDSVSVDLKTIANSEVLAFPHAYANRITNSADRPSFLPRNAIDGYSETSNSLGHINFGGHSWGGGRAADLSFYDDLTFVLYFGREVTITELAFVMRADYSGTPAHDTHFTEITAEFSDGSEIVLDGFETGSTRQAREIDAKKTTYVRLKNFERYIHASNGGWAALTEFEAIGTDAGKNAPATKTTFKNTFGGKPIKYKTTAYRAQAIKDIVDFSCADVAEVVTARAAENWWRDGVLFSALMDAYTTTGTLGQYLYNAYAADKYQYQIKRNEGGRGNKSAKLSAVYNGTFTGLADVTDFADDYLVGETWLMMHDLKPSPHKRFSTYATADANMKDRPSWDATFNKGNGQSRPPNLADANVYDWWWCDAIYMGLNYFTFMSNDSHDPAYLEKAFDSYEYWKGVLACYDTNKTAVSAGTHADHGHADHGGDWALWHRDMDSVNYRMNSQLSPASPNTLPTFWARGNAWVFAGVAKQLLYIDETQFPAIYEAYKNDFLAMAKTLKAYQHEDGHWRASVIDPDHPRNNGNGKESTGTSGYVYGLAIGVQLGILPANEYWDSVQKGFEALLAMRQNGDGRLGYMQTVGYDAAGDPGENPTSVSSFGYGLFIHAASAIMRMCSDYQAPELRVPADGQYGVMKVPEYAGVKN